MKFSHLIFGLMIGVGACSAGTTEAYFTTRQTAETFGPTTEVFTITYHFGATDREFLLPITALRDTLDTTNKQLGFSIVDGSNKPTTLGTTTALVLSHAAIRDGRYVVPAGTSTDFTLVTVWTRPAGTSALPYRMLVTSLPFTMNVRGTAYENHLNPSELQYYITPPLHHITVSYTLKQK